MPKRTVSMRDLDVYAKGMDASLLDKWQRIKLWVAAEPEGSAPLLVDEGCGTGKLLRLLAQRYPNARIVGRDASPEFVRRSIEETRDLSNVSVVLGDLSTPVKGFQHGTVTTKIFSSVLHEVFSTNGYTAAPLRKVLKQSFKDLRPGGRILIRDGVKPEPELVFLWLDHSRYQRHGNPGMLSARERFFRFVQDFRPVREVPYYRIRTGSIGGERIGWLVALESQNAYEFLLKKDYVENWETELRVIFGFWTFTEYQKELRSAGFAIRCLSSFCSPWLVEHRLKPAARLFRLNEQGKLEPSPFFPTHVFAVAERPIPT